MDDAPMLQYARAESRADPYSWCLLIAGLPGMLALFLPLDDQGSFLEITAREVGRSFRHGNPADMALAIALAASVLTPLTAAGWRCLRIRPRGIRPGAGAAGMVLASLHACGLVGVFGGLALIHDGSVFLGVVGLTTVTVCACCFAALYLRRGVGDAVLLALVSCEIAFFAAATLWFWMLRLPMNPWHAILAATVLVRCVEFAYLARRGLRASREVAAAPVG